MEFANMLNEICKVSAIKATTALSKVLKMPLGFAMNPVEIKDITQLGMLLSPNEMTANFFVPIKGNLTGASFFLFSQPAAFAMSDILLKRSPGTTQSFKEEEISALSEVANIVIGNFLTSLAHSFQLDSLMHKSAIYEQGKFNEILNNIVAAVHGEMGNQTLVNISFAFEHLDIKGYVMVVFDSDKIKYLMKNVFAIG